MKKFVSVIMAFIMIFVMFVPAIAVDERGQKGVPIVYIGGKATHEIKKDGKVVPFGEIEDGYILDAVKDCLPLLGKALAVGKIDKSAWDAYYARLKSWVEPIYADTLLDDEGNPQNGVGVHKDYDIALKPNEKNSYGLFDYHFTYDWRLSPSYNAEILGKYIDNILTATNSDKVNLVGRCEGGCVVDAYLQSYGHSKVNRIVYYSSSSKELLGLGEAFAGNFNLNADAAARFAATALVIDDPIMNEFLTSTIALAGENGLLDIASVTLSSFLMEYISPIMPELIRCSYGKFPSVWAMIESKYFDDAVKYVFGGVEEQYPVFLEKIRNYERDVKANIDKNVIAAQNDGVVIGTVSKYGHQNVPLGSSADILSDGDVAVRSTTFGATTAPSGGVLTKEYIEKVTAEGNGKYISPDNQIDVSTSMFKDTTWLIKYIEHADIPNVIDNLVLSFFRSEEVMTVESNPDYPQFMVYDKENKALVPMTEENSSFEYWDGFTNVGFFKAFINFIKALFALIGQKIGEMFNA